MLNSTILHKALATGLGSAALTFLGIATIVSQAHAATMTQNISVANTSTNWVTGSTPVNGFNLVPTLNFNRFNTSLGTLNSVKIQMTGTVIGSGSVTNKVSTPISNGTYTLSARIELFDSTGLNSLGFVRPIYQDVFSSTNRLSGNATKTYSPMTLTHSLNSGNGVTYSTNQYLNYFIGSGTGTLVSRANGISGWTGTSNVTATALTSAAVDYVITYDYTPAAVPEPLTILGAATAVGFGAAFKRRALKKSKKD